MYIYLIHTLHANMSSKTLYIIVDQSGGGAVA